MKKILIGIICVVGISISADKTSNFDVKGMMCAGGCVKKINRAMDSIEGIKSRSVDFEKSSMTVVYDDQIVNEKMIITALKENNYSCSLKEKPKSDSPVISFFKNLFN
tara:strand:- start:1880 stop:2203 length:324 start_codon:yes stop_codon:yes gene_type:complete